MHRILLIISILSVVSEILISQGRVTVVQKDPAGISLEYRAPLFRPDTVIVGNVPQTYFREIKSMGGEPGVLTLPTESFLVALPPGSRPLLEGAHFTVRSANQTRLARVPRITVLDDSLNTVIETFPEGGPVDPLVLEDRRVRIAGVFRWRGYNLARIEIRPLGYDPNGGILTQYSAGSFRVTFEGEFSSSESVSGDDPHFDRVFRTMVLNADQAQGWKTAPRFDIPNSAAVTDSSREWFDPLKTYLKIPIAQDGLFSISFDSIISALGTIGPFPSHGIALYHQGNRLPLFVTGPGDNQFGAGDSLVFFGTKLRDSNGNSDEFSDTSIYWLSVDEDSAATVIADPGSGAPTDTIRSFRHTIRLEKDSIYFFGNGGLPTNNTSGQVPGEGWYWSRLFVNQSRSFAFTVANPDTSIMPLVFSGRFHSPVQGQATPTHNIEIRINGSLIGSMVFNNNRDTTFSVGFPASLIQQGANTVNITSLPTAASLNEIYVDWFRIEAEEKPVAVLDSLLLRPDEFHVNKVAHFAISGFSTPMITAVRLGPDGHIEKWLAGTVTGSGPYTKVFEDTVLSGRTYAVFGSNRYQSVSQLERKQFLDLRSNVAGADYVIVTHRELTSAAGQLTTYRSQKGIGRTAVVFVDDIYDEFNFGHQSPFAIRSFLRAADSLWPDPNPSYVVLFGDANWDSRNNLGSARRNLVPSFGNPVSDAFYAASSFDGLLPERYIGRIPVQTPQQAAQFISHVIAYEAQPLSAWNKTFLFMSAGYTASEAIRFQSFSDGLITSYVEASPVTGFGSRIYRPPSNVIGFDVNDSILSILQNGALWMNFYGHAGTEIWANGISQPDQLANTSGKRHLISDISCSTARFAEPSIEAFGERMVLGDVGGAIGYIGSSGFGYESPLRILADEMYKTVALDTLREFGMMLLAAKVRLWNVGTSLLNRQALEQFTLLGDPATRLALAIAPDYVADNTGINSMPDQPTESDSIRIQIPVANYGLQARDTVIVRIEHSFQSVESQLSPIILPPIGAGDTLIIGSALFQQPGQHELNITIDSDMQLSEVSESNNSAVFPFFVLSQQLLPLQPLPLSVHHPDSTTLIVQNPNQPNAAGWNVFFEVGTLDDFSGSSVVRSPGILQGIYKSEWTVPPNILSDSGLYFWRGRLSSGLDSTNWIGGTFWTRPVKRDEWHQEGSMLIDVNTTVNVIEQNSARLIYADKPIILHSAGFDAGDSAAMYVDGQNISIGFTERGYNVAVLNPATAAVEQFGAFRIYSDPPPDTSLAESLIQFLTNIPQGSIVLMAIADEGAVNKTERLNQAIESMGSAMIRSLGFRSSWALVGRKGAAIGSVPEILKAAGAGPATLTDTLLFAATAGMVTTPFIGPASGWNTVSLIADTSQTGTHISFDLIRKHNSGLIDTVAGIPSGTTPLGPFVGPPVREVRLLARLSSDVPGVSPGLLAWSVSFDPPSELGLNYQTVSVNRDTVLEGETVTVTAVVQNTGLADAANAGMRVSYSGVVLDSARVNVPSSGETTQVLVVPTTGLPGRPVFVVELDPDDEIPEQFEANNIFSFAVQVQGDTVSPMFQVSFDGMTIFENDYVRPEPEIWISIRDNSPLPITDPNSVVLRLNNRRITLGSAPDSLFETLTGSEKARVTFRPILAKGDYLLSVQVLDASGNPADSMEYEIRFKVETDLRLLNVFNFPNPFSTETAFTFHLTGAGVAEEVNLRVYTTAGRLIYERRLLPGEVNIGFNRIPWNGRDQNGDPVANGVYFYKVSAVQDGKRVEVVEKLARVR